ncbi:MAG: TIGR03936 family radical SAM-associated protein [Eubacterium sp.]|nr:TIGR03936 family radical SAM-associated protein [Eubacterium sp.]
MKVRVKFSKRGPVKYVGHLDMMRYFQKAIRRAGIDISYSEGYSPHMIMSFASPLGVGMESDAEYFDMQLNSHIEPDEAIRLLNEQMAEGVLVTAFTYLPENAKKSMTITSATDYIVTFRDGYERPCDNLSKKINEFMAQGEINVLKKTKKSETMTDIKPLIYSFCEEGGDLKMCLAAGSVANLNVKLLLETFWAFCGREFNPYSVQIIRSEVYMTGDGGLEPLCK